MYVCICNGHTDHDIRRIAARDGSDCVDQTYAALGGAVCCGSCRDCAKEIIDDTLAQIATPMLVAAE